MNKEFITLSSKVSIFMRDNEDSLITEADFNTVLGTGGSDDPLIAFCDKEQLISSEQYSYYGRWRGWKHEIIEDKKEYFKRKLKGK